MHRTLWYGLKVLYEHMWHLYGMDVKILPPYQLEEVESAVANKSYILFLSEKKIADKEVQESATNYYVTNVKLW